MFSKIIATGSYLPEKILTNEELSKTVDTSDEWISSRTGIRQRHIAAEGQLTSDLALQAAKEALKKADLDASSIDLIIVATTTPDLTFPSTATKVQEQLGITEGAAFDLQAVCSGFVYALSVADALIKTKQHKRILVIGAEKMSSILNWEDRNTCVLFGDGAGALILEANENNDACIIDSKIRSDGRYKDILYVNGGVGENGLSGTIVMQGKEVFKHAADKMSSIVKEVLKDNNYTLDNLDLLIPHQANFRIMEMVGKKLALPKDKVISTVQDHANTSAASIPLALDRAVNENKISSGQLVATTAMGAGLTWGTNLFRF